MCSCSEKVILLPHEVFVFPVHLRKDARWAQWTHCSARRGLHASPRPGGHAALSLSCSPPVHRCAHAGMRRCISSARRLPCGFFSFCSFACLLWVVRNLGEHAGKGYFLILYYWILHCSGEISCEKKLTNEIPTCLAATELCVVG